ncbi:unnamed protein product [Closterium sp. NIES-64]|nr:unnamed protein product [Closterium sp. NIES-64]
MSCSREVKADAAQGSSSSEPSQNFSLTFSISPRFSPSPPFSPESAVNGGRYAMGLSIRAMHCLIAIPGVMHKVQPVLVNSHEMVMPAFGRLIRFSVPKVGADGVRSYVRNMLAARTWDFPVHTDRVYHDLTVVSIPVAPTLTPTSLFFTAKVTNTKNIGAVAMPQVGGEMCLVWGWKSTDPPLDWLSLASPAAAKQYLHERLPCLDVPKEAAWKLLKQKPRTSMQVKCWRYHDNDAQVALIGDAVHSTLPTLGQGCNASITDALVLGRLLLGEAVSENVRVPRPLGKDGAAAAAVVDSEIIGMMSLPLCAYPPPPPAARRLPTPSSSPQFPSSSLSTHAPSPHSRPLCHFRPTRLPNRPQSLCLTPYFLRQQQLVQLIHVKLKHLAEGGMGMGMGRTGGNEWCRGTSERVVLAAGAAQSHSSWALGMEMRKRRRCSGGL